MHYVIPCITNDISEWDSSDLEEPQLYIRAHGDVYLRPPITSYSVIENFEKLGHHLTGSDEVSSRGQEMLANLGHLFGHLPKRLDGQSSLT